LVNSHLAGRGFQGRRYSAWELILRGDIRGAEFGQSVEREVPEKKTSLAYGRKHNLLARPLSVVDDSSSNHSKGDKESRRVDSTPGYHCEYFFGIL
jgi:hypothetical protein